MRGWIGGGLGIAAGCASDPCFHGQCVGEIAIDLTGDRPVFSMVGAGARPDAFQLDRSSGCRSSTAVWDIDPLRQAGPIEYGVVPADSRSWFYRRGERVEGEPPDLVVGETYLASFWVRSAAMDDWSGFFVMGDPDSFELSAERCP